MDADGFPDQLRVIKVLREDAGMWSVKRSAAMGTFQCSTQEVGSLI